MVLRIDRASKDSLTGQICRQIRAQILNGTLPSGCRLPSTRALSVDYSISRNIFTEVYEQLTAEGYIEAGTGRGTFVSSVIRPVKFLQSADSSQPAKTAARKKWKADFSVGTPDPSLFPLEKWAAVLRKSALSLTPEEMGYGANGGSLQLREALTDFLMREKGINASAEEIFICAGSFQAILLAAEVVKQYSHCKNPPVVIENPAYITLSTGLAALGAKIIPVDSDEKGIDPAELEELDGFSAVCVTPSHLFPGGGVYPIDRRLKLSERADRKDFFIIENDFEGDFRLRGTPVPSVFSLGSGRVLNVGTFSQLLYPACRIGYLVVPQELAEITESVYSAIGMGVPVANQNALADFISTGLLNRHRRKMKRVYQKRQSAFLDSLNNSFGNEIRLSGTESGLFVLAAFDGILFDDKAKNMFERSGVKADFEYRHYWPADSRLSAPGLLLGYGLIPEEEATEKVELLHKLILLNKDCQSRFFFIGCKHE